MGDGVVDVQQVELLLSGDLHHFRGEDQLIGRVVEEGVLRNADLVVVDVGPETAEAHRLVVSDEVYLVALGGEGLAELRGHDTAPPKVG